MLFTMSVFVYQKIRTFDFSASFPYNKGEIKKETNAVRKAAEEIVNAEYIYS